MASLDKNTRTARAERIRRTLEQRLLAQTNPTKFQKELRQKFLALEHQLRVDVMTSELSDSDKCIQIAHDRAVRNWELMYDDPVTNLKVMTRWRHFLKGECCGSGCRHCIYQHEKVPDDIKRTKVFNSVFWKNVE